MERVPCRGIPCRDILLEIPGPIYPYDVNKQSITESTAQRSAGTARFGNVLILSASAGAGHVRAAQAIERAFIAMGAARQVRHVDVLEHTTKVFRTFYSRAHIEIMNKAPDLLGWLYDQYDRPWKSDPIRIAFEKLNTRPFVRLLREYEPDVVICTHFLPAEIIAYLRAKERLGIRQAIVVTDFDVHAMWLCRHFEHYFVPLEETRVHLSRLGISASQISTTGIPIDPVFMEQKTQADMRRQFGLDPDRTTILLSAGGYGVGPIDNIMQSLMEMRHPAQVLAMCGRNGELLERMRDLEAAGGAGNSVTVHAIGYTTAMDEYMAASDIVVGKPGGLTTSEALAKGLVFVIIDPIRGQEERNADHLLEEGVALRCNNLPALAYKIDRLLDDRARFDAMRRNALRMARPRAAFEIVEKLLELRGEWQNRPDIPTVV